MDSKSSENACDNVKKNVKITTRNSLSSSSAGTAIRTTSAEKRDNRYKTFYCSTQNIINNNNNYSNLDMETLEDMLKKVYKTNNTLYLHIPEVLYIYFAVFSVSLRP